MSVVAKFEVTSVTQHKEGVTDVVMNPVYHGNDPDHPNRKFWEATPSGSVRMTITVPDAGAYFKPGRVYALTFKAEKPRE